MICRAVGLKISPLFVSDIGSTLFWKFKKFTNPKMFPKFGMNLFDGKT